MSAAMELAVRAEQLLGSQIEIKLPKQHAHFFSECFAEIKRIEGAYSRFLEGSELSRLNRRLGAWQHASPELLVLVSKAEEFREKTKGNFDITLKSALDAIGYDRDYSFKPHPQPTPGLLQRIQRLSGSIRIDPKKSRILLNKEIDFGGFGKGFALDKVRELLESRGVSHYYINAGGDIFAAQGKGCEPWPILLEHPDDPSMAIGKISLDNRAIAASAPNRRKWGEFHHLLNARTGKPAMGVKAIFVIAKTGLEADAYATALFTAGFEEGIVISKNLPVELLIVSSQDKMYQSQGFGAELFG